MIARLEQQLKMLAKHWKNPLICTEHSFNHPEKMWMDWTAWAASCVTGLCPQEPGLGGPFSLES
jgi:hypothetical protein